MGRTGRILIGFAVSLLAFVPLAQAQEKVKFATSWIFYGRDAYLFAAREKGFFRQAGFDVELNRGRGGANTVTWVSVRSMDFGFAGGGALIAGRAREAKVKEIAVVFARAPHAFIFLKDSGIQKPKDLEGRTLASVKGSDTDSTFPAFASLAGFDASKVKFHYMDSPSQLPSLFTGQVAGFPFFITELPVFLAKSRELNKPIGTFLWADYGFHIYSDGIIAHQEDIDNKPDRVRRFLKACIEGIAYAIDHPEEATKLFLKFNPEFSPEIALAQWKITIDLLATPEAKKNGIGWMLPEKTRATRDVMVKALNLKTDVKAEDLYTNQFNPKILPKAWK